MQAEIATMPVQPLEQPTINVVGYADAHRVPDIGNETGQGWRRRVGQIVGRTALALGLATGAAALTTTEATPAHASDVGCYGDYCSGRYANETGCDQDAVTLDKADITQRDWEFGFPDIIHAGDAVKVGTIELRYSPTCKTKWARAQTFVRNGVSDVAVTQDTGYNQGRHIGGFSTGSPAGISDSPMIYSPNDAVHAYVGGGSGDLISVSTEWK